jgi:hypothetical protein
MIIVKGETYFFHPNYVLQSFSFFASSFHCYFYDWWMQIVQESSCPESGSKGCYRVCQICYEGTVSAKALIVKALGDDHVE